MENKIIICDLDGCLIDSSWIWQANKILKLGSPQCWELFENNANSSWNNIDEYLLNFLKQKLKAGFNILFLTARSQNIEAETKKFIEEKTGLKFDNKRIFSEFRPVQDESAPADFKFRVVDRYIQLGFEFGLGIDDDKSVVDMYKTKKIPALCWKIGFVPRTGEFFDEIISWRNLPEDELTTMFEELVEEINKRKAEKEAK